MLKVYVGAIKMKSRKGATLTRPIDNLGRIVIPKEIRNSLDLYTGKHVSIYTYGSSIILSAMDERNEADSHKPVKSLPPPLMEDITEAAAQLGSEDVLAWVDVLRRMARIQTPGDTGSNPAK